ncbi:MAG: Mut7-C RNAse domain-containing protein [Brevinematia bacterium]
MARYLRMLGFSAEYYNHVDDKDLIGFLKRDSRLILLTKDRVLKNENQKYSKRILLISSDDKLDQTVEVLVKLQIGNNKLSPFSRCLICNSKLVKIRNKKLVKDLIPKETYESFEEFYRCPKCKKVFWFSTHTERMSIIIERIMEKVRKIG